VSLPTWEKLQPLRRCYVRLLDPDGDVFDVWQNHLEATLEGLNEHHRIFRSEKEWQSFLQGQRNIATDWDLRHTLTAADRRLLAELKIVWEQQEHTRKKIYPPIPAGHALVRTSDGALHHLPAENIEKARAIDPELQVLHIEP
jgi:hypothetical protein